MNGWDRVPDTLRAHVRVENYLRGLMGQRCSYTTILRLTRILELRQVDFEGTDGVYWELRDLHPDLVDHNNEVLRALRRRALRPKPRPTITLADYIALPPLVGPR